MIKGKFNLIPRYNWDYSFSDWLSSLSVIFDGKRGETRKIENFFGRQPIFTTSGRTSLYTILKSLELPKGAGVAVPLFCCDVVFEAIRQAELMPVFVDINKEDYNISAEDLDKKKKLFSAVVIVHMFGHPADMDAILAVTDNTPVIEDCAQSLDSCYKGRLTGFLADASFFSFRSGKYISAGEGSAIFSKNETLRKRIKRLVRTYPKWTTGQQILHCTATAIKTKLYQRPLFGTVGYLAGQALDPKMNLTAKKGFKLNQIPECDLTIINDRFESISLKINKQRNNANLLLANIHMPNTFMNYEKKGCHSNYYQFPIRHPTTEQRDRMAVHLLNNGIDTAKYLDSIIETAKKTYGYRGDCPNTELCSKTTLIIPHYYTLSDQDLEHIIKCVNNFRP